jgi:hypothetical protein
MEFPSFPHSKELTTSYISHNQVLEYINRFMDHFKLRQYIRVIYVQHFKLRQYIRVIYVQHFKLRQYIRVIYLQMENLTKLYMLVRTCYNISFVYHLKNTISNNEVNKVLNVIKIQNGNTKSSVGYGTVEK